MSEWVSVDERLPEADENELVLAYGERLSDRYELYPIGERDYMKGDGVTHWMFIPLPPPPDAVAKWRELERKGQ